MRLGRFTTGFIVVLVLVPALVFAIRTVAPGGGEDTSAPVAVEPAAPAPAEPLPQAAPPDNSDDSKKRRHRTEKPKPRAAQIEIAEQDTEQAAPADDSPGELLVSKPDPETSPEPQPLLRAGTLEEVTQPVKEILDPVRNDIPEKVGRIIPPGVDLVEAPEELPEVEVPEVLTPVTELPETPELPEAVVLPETDVIDPNEDEESPTPALVVDPRSELGRAVLKELGIKRSKIHGAWLSIDLATFAEQSGD